MGMLRIVLVSAIRGGRARARALARPQLVRPAGGHAPGVAAIGTKPRQWDIETLVERELVRDHAIVLLAVRTGENCRFYIYASRVLDRIWYLFPGKRLFAERAARMAFPGETLRQRLLFRQRELLLGRRLIVAESAEATWEELAPFPCCFHLRHDLASYFFIIFLGILFVQNAVVSLAHSSTPEEMIGIQATL